MPSTKSAVVVTGFGPFGAHKVNSSSVAIKTLKEEGLHNDRVELHIAELPVEYEAVKKMVPWLWKQYDPKLVVHVGVSGIATELHLEQQAHNDGYERLDNCGTCPEKKCCVDDAEDCLVSGINMEKVCQCVNEADIKIKASVSHDPGRYLCDFVYYTSLHINRSCVAFIHVPPLDASYSASELAAGLRVAINAMLDQIS